MTGKPPSSLPEKVRLDAKGAATDQGAELRRIAKKTAEEAQADTSLLSRRLFVSPAPQRLILPIAAVSLLSATIIAATNPRWDSLTRDFLALALPIYGSALLTLPIAKGFGGHTYLRRTTLQAFFDALTVLSFVVVIGIAELAWWAMTGTAFPYAAPTLLILGFSATSWLRHAVWIATSHHSHLCTLPATAVTPALGFLAVKLAYGTTVGDDVLAVVLFLVFLAAGIAFTVAPNAPLRHA